MYIRKLEKKDAELMLEWMHDKSVVEVLPTDFLNKTLDDCLRFIQEAQDEKSNNLHYAISDENDEYMGTISLKNIDMYNRNAEYAVTIRKCAMGKGYSKYATNEILKVAFEKLNLNKIYLCVFSDNVRAKKFYHKFNFTHEGTFRKHLLSNDNNFHDLEWYSYLKSEYFSENGEI